MFVHFVVGQRYTYIAFIILHIKSVNRLSQMIVQKAQQSCGNS